jgi:hypothetical protein
MFDSLFSVSLTFFGVFCVLIGHPTFRSKFLPAILGLLMMATCSTYWINSFRLLLASPVRYLPWVTPNEVGARGIGEIGLAWRRRRNYFGGTPYNRCLRAEIAVKD